MDLLATLYLHENTFKTIGDTRANFIKRISKKLHIYSKHRNKMRNFVKHSRKKPLNFHQKYKKNFRFCLKILGKKTPTDFGERSYKKAEDFIKRLQKMTNFVERSPKMADYVKRLQKWDISSKD